MIAVSGRLGPNSKRGINLMFPSDRDPADETAANRFTEWLEAADLSEPTDVHRDFAK
jgi:hypothetical protein